jgi:predicted permease
LSGLLILFSNNILPIFLASGAGYLISKFLKVPPRPVSQIAFYIFSPCLIFNLLTTSELSGQDISRMAGFTFTVVLLLGLLTILIGYVLRLERRLLAAVLLTTMFGNAGNYGLSLNLFAFGEKALAHASLYFVTTAIMIYTIGVFIASMGNSNFGQSLLGLLKVPAIYAVALAFAFNRFHLLLPLPLDRTVTILSDAAIPVLMVLLGIQLEHSEWDGKTMALSVSNLMRLIAAPALALLLSFVFGLEGDALKAGVLESAMPTAVLMTVLATEYDVEPSFVTSVVFITTLLSPITVTPLLAYLGA